MGVWTDDLTDLEEAREETKRNVEAHDEILNRIDDAVVIFDRAKRVSFHNTAFAELWGLEHAWLTERPTHGEVLEKGLAVMDIAAVALARENSIPIIVFSIHEKGGFAEILTGGGRKTIVSDN